ncbi:MAG: hypothetical protein ACFFC1_13840 [Promethearchaeota archaeon]
MKFKKSKYKKIPFIICILVLPILLSFTFNSNSTPKLPRVLGRQNSVQPETSESLRTSKLRTYTNNSWLQNPTFNLPIEPTWFTKYKGDLSDVNASTSSGHVNFEILGENRNFLNVSGTPQAEHWIEFNNTYFILPDGTHEVNLKGCEASHEFQESTDQSRNRPSVHWRRNITMPNNMSDYIITSASITTLVNGSADTNIETPVDDLSFDGAGYFSTYYDYARFYVKVSNLDYENLYEIAYYQTVTLGQGDQTRQGTGVIDYLNDTLINAINESILIFYLTKALEKDPYHLGITLGIDIYCEDNYDQYDRDTFYSLLIKSCNLTFTYEKKIDQLTAVSWNQEAPAVSGNNVTINLVNLNFRYKINKNWSSSLSPNSEIEIYINNRKHSETIKLSTVTTTFEYAKIGGFDLSNILLPYEDITFTIQVLLADEFELDRIITLSIDDVYLSIIYTETIPDPSLNPEPLIFWILLLITSIAALTIGSYFIVYQKLLKYPKPVRKVRKYRRTLNQENEPSTEIEIREIAFSRVYQKKISKSSKLLKGKSIGKSSLIEKIRIKSPEKSLNTQNILEESGGSKSK